MKKKTKIISSLALALVLGLGTAGCSLDKEKTNALMEKGETFLDAQNSEDYKKMYEDLKAYLEETKNLDVDKIHDFLDKYDGLDVDALNKYLEEANSVTSEEAVDMLSDKIIDFVVNSLGKNYTVKVGNKVSRVEFVSDKLTKIYPDVKIFTLLPLWRGKDGAKNVITFNEMREILINVCKKYKNITLIDAIDFIPHDANFFLPDLLHPNTMGFRIYGENLVNALKLYLED